MYKYIWFLIFMCFFQVGHCIKVSDMTSYSGPIDGTELFHLVTSPNNTSYQTSLQEVVNFWSTYNINVASADYATNADTLDSQHGT